ncbi:MAG TPA: DNA helicase, partial [Armatimonadota bacterium]|nr:DNA helicase [Armatimonadota bacterium]
MSDIGFKPKVAISMEFLERFGQLPPEVRQKAKRFVEKFRENPVSKAINYEKIHSARDSKIRTVRIDGGYRAVVVHPPKGDVYTLVWIDKHDEAINWTRNRQFEVNPVEGSFQIIPIEREEAVPEKPAATAVQGLFDSLDDNTLLSFGLPQILLPSVRKIKTRGDFENLMPYLPEEVPEALFWLAEGDSPEEVRAAMNKPATPAEVDTDDFAKALEHPDSKRRFVVDPTPDELERMLEAPLEKWRVFLHPDQERLVMRTFNGPAQVLGGAGTGKTVVAMHRARHLARQIGPDED